MDVVITSATIPSKYYNGSIKSSSSSLLLHEAAKRYDSQYLLALLQESHCDVQVKDDQGRNTLHVLLEDGFSGHLNEPDMLACVKILLDFRIDINCQTKLKHTSLFLSVNNAFSRCTQMLLEAGAPCDVELATKIAHTMPEILLEIFDSGVTVYDESKGSPSVKLDWGKVIQFPNDHDPTSQVLSFRQKQKETQFLYNLLDVKSETRKHFLNHPLVEAFVYLKNTQMARKLRIFFLVSIFFPFFYGTFIYFLYFERCKIHRHDDNNSTAVIPQTKTKCDITWPITIASALLYLVIGCWTLLEVYMQFRVDRRYLISWRTWVARTSLVVMSITLWPGLQYNEEYNITFQYPIASLGIFLAWVMFLLQVGLYQKFSIYLEMLVKILLSVLKIILMFLPLFFGFFMGFNLLFDDMGSIFSFIRMTVDSGSASYDNLVDDVKDQALWFEALAYTFSVGFIIIIVIVFMNYLLALSVQDVETLKGQAELASISRTVQNLFVVDLLFPSAVLIPKELVKIGNYSVLYDPKEGKNSLGLPPKILMKITLLLKEKRAKELERDKMQIENELLRNHRLNSSLNESETNEILIKRLIDMDTKLENMTKKLVSLEQSRK